MGQKRDTTPHEPTDATRQLVQLHASTGTPQELIARLIGIDPKTLRKHYRDELDLSLAQANAVAAKKLFDNVKAGDNASVFFWLKTRARWSERQEIDHTSSDGTMSPKDNQTAVLAALARKHDAG